MSRPVDRLAYFAQMVDERPDEPRARFSYANELLRAGRDAEAVEQLEAYLALAEDEGNGWGRLAGALTALGRADAAADAYLRGIDQAIAFGHHGMADELQAALDAL